MENRTLYAVLTLLTTQLGVPCFMQGKVKGGIILLVLTLVPVVGWVMGPLNFIMGIIKAIPIFKMTDEEYAAADKEALLGGIPLIK